MLRKPGRNSPQASVAHRKTRRARGLCEKYPTAGYPHFSRLVLRLEGPPDRATGQLGVRVRLGVGDAAVDQQPVQLVVARHPQPRRKETLAHQPDLVLDLPLRYRRPRIVAASCKSRRVARSATWRVLVNLVRFVTASSSRSPSKLVCHRRCATRGRDRRLSPTSSGEFKSFSRRCRVARRPIRENATCVERKRAASGVVLEM